MNTPTIPAVVLPVHELVKHRMCHMRLLRVVEERGGKIALVYSDNGPSPGFSLFPGLLRELLTIEHFACVTVFSKSEVHFVCFSD